MGWFSHVIVLLCVVGAQLTTAYPQQKIGNVQNDPLIDENTGQNFAKVFARSLEMCGSFSHAEAEEFRQIIEVMTKAFGSFPNIQKAPPAVLKATTAGFASAIAERTAEDIKKGELFTKTQCVVQALRKAFLKATGVTNPYFISEVERLIEVFYITRGFPDSPVDPLPTDPPQVQPQNQPQGQPQN